MYLSVYVRVFSIFFLMNRQIQKYSYNATNTYKKQSLIQNVFMKIKMYGLLVLQLFLQNTIIRRFRSSVLDIIHYTSYGILHFSENHVAYQAVQVIHKHLSGVQDKFNHW